LGEEIKRGKREVNKGKGKVGNVVSTLIFSAEGRREKSQKKREERRKMSYSGAEGESKREERDI